MVNIVRINTATLRDSFAGSNRQFESLHIQQSFSLNDHDQVKEIEDGTIAGVSTASTFKVERSKLFKIGSEDQVGEFLLPTSDFQPITSRRQIYPERFEFSIRALFCRPTSG